MLHVLYRWDQASPEVSDSLAICLKDNGVPLVARRNGEVVAIGIVLVWLDSNPGPVDFSNSCLRVPNLGSTDSFELVAMQFDSGEAIILEKKQHVVPPDDLSQTTLVDLWKLFIYGNLHACLVGISNGHANLEWPQA